MAQAQAYVIAGYRFVVDIDLAKFFDRVNHDRLMAAVAVRVADRRLLRLIRSYLTAGVLDNGVFEESREGTPQGGPLSPLLSRISCWMSWIANLSVAATGLCVMQMMHIYVRSEKAGRRIMESLTRFIERRLKLQVNAEKSAVARPWHRSFLGFTVRNEPELRRCIADKAVIRFKHRVRELTRRHRGITLERMIRELASYFGDGPATSASASGASCNPSMAGCGDAYVASSGSSGRRVAGDTGTPPSQRPRTGGQRGHLQPQGAVATEFHVCHAPRLHQCALQTSGPAPWRSC